MLVELAAHGIQSLHGNPCLPGPAAGAPDRGRTAGDATRERGGGGSPVPVLVVAASVAVAVAVNHWVGGGTVNAHFYIVHR